MGEVRVDSAAAWAAVCSDAFVPLRVHTTAPCFEATLHGVELTSEVSVTRVASHGSDVIRSAQVISEHPRDDVLLSIHRHGRATIAQSGRRAHLPPGGAAFYDASTPYALHFPGRMSELVLQLPRRCVTGTGRGFDDLTAVTVPPSAGLTALHHLVAAATDPSAPPAGHPVERELLADAALSLVRATLSGIGASPASRVDARVMALALRTHIDDRHTDPTLTVERLAAAHHVSVRLVTQVFGRHVDDSPGAYLRRRRLETARQHLLDGRSVIRSALDSGFTDPDTFARAFKRHYGHPPSTLRAS